MLLMVNSNFVKILWVEYLILKQSLGPSNHICLDLKIFTDRFFHWKNLIVKIKIISKTLEKSCLRI